MKNTIMDRRQFIARSGNPNNISAPAWAARDLERRNTMLFDVPSTAVDDPHKEERLFMARYASQQDGGNALHRLNILIQLAFCQF